MHPFFRPKRALASAPETTPYQRASQIWDDRMGLGVSGCQRGRLLHRSRLQEDRYRRIARERLLRRPDVSRIRRRRRVQGRRGALVFPDDVRVSPR